MSDGMRTLLMTLGITAFAVTLLDVLLKFKDLIDPGVSQIYNALGPFISPNMVTIVVFDWRGYDTLGEALILVTAVVVTMLIFGRGNLKLKGGEEE